MYLTTSHMSTLILNTKISCTLLFHMFSILYIQSFAYIYNISMNLSLKYSLSHISWSIIRKKTLVICSSNVPHIDSLNFLKFVLLKNAQNHNQKPYLLLVIFQMNNSISLYSIWKRQILNIFCIFDLYHLHHHLVAVATILQVQIHLLCTIFVLCFFSHLK